MSLLVTQQMDSPRRWQSLLSSVETHESVQEAIITRCNILASMSAFDVTSSDALEQLIQDILLNTEALENTLGVTAANVNISPHAASIRRAWHETWALCHGTSSISSGQPTCMGPTLASRDSRWRHTTRVIAQLKQHARPVVLCSNLPPLETRKPSRVDAEDPDHQREDAHGAPGEEMPTTPFQPGTLNPNVLGRYSTD